LKKKKNDLMNISMSISKRHKQVIIQSPFFLLFLIVLELIVILIYINIYPSIVPIAQRIDKGIISSVPILYVVDGDTVSVSINGVDTRVRLIGINAPEQYGVKVPECYTKESTNSLKELVANKVVQLEADPTQDDTDIYGRLLRYIRLPDGTNVNLIMIRNGSAREYTFKKPYQYQSEFKKAETEAKRNNVGLWSNCILH